MGQDIVYFNGDFLPKTEVQIDLEDRGYQFADGVYEVVVTYNDKPFKMDEHFQRLQNSAEALGIQFHDYSKLKEDAHKLLDKSSPDTAKLYIQITRGVSKRSHGFEDDLEPQVVMTVRKFGRNPEQYYEEGVKAISVPDERWPRCHIKTIALLPNILAKKEAHNAGAYEAIQIKDGFITEGTSSNVFIVKENKVVTPPATNYILNGISRRVVLNGLEEMDIPVKRQSISKKELFEAEEVFLTGTTSEIMPVVEIDEQVINTGKPGPITKKTQNYYFNLINI